MTRFFRAPRRAATPVLACAVLFLSMASASAQVVALGASQTYGKGVERSPAYPAQLESMLRAKGSNVRIENAGINGDTTGGMLGRLGSAVPSGTKIVILQPGGNDMRKGTGADRGANISAIMQRLNARGIKVIMLENGNFAGLPHQADGVHLTPEGYRAIAERLLPQVTSAIGR
jgi:acyl-CoA thioesterase I